MGTEKKKTPGEKSLARVVSIPAESPAARNDRVKSVRYGYVERTETSGSSAMAHC